MDASVIGCAAGLFDIWYPFTKLHSGIPKKAINIPVIFIEVWLSMGCEVISV
jgi:hypothetical protein